MVMPKRSKRTTKPKAKNRVVDPITSSPTNYRRLKDGKIRARTQSLTGEAKTMPISIPQLSVEVPNEKPDDGERVTVKDLRDLNLSGIYDALLDALVSPNDRRVIREHSDWVWWWRQDKKRHKGPKFSDFKVKDRASAVDEVKRLNYEIYAGFMREIREAFPPGITDARRLVIAEKLLIKASTLKFINVLEQTAPAREYRESIEKKLIEEIDTSRMALGINSETKNELPLVFSSVWIGQDEVYRKQLHNWLLNGWCGYDEVQKKFNWRHSLNDFGYIILKTESCLSTDRRYKKLAQEWLFEKLGTPVTEKKISDAYHKIRRSGEYSPSTQLAKVPLP
jgi:hypothetical protein